MNFEFIKTSQERINICKKCKNKHFDVVHGTICSLSGKKPTFDNICPDFKIDIEEVKKLKNTIISHDNTTTEIKRSLLEKTIYNYNFFFRKKPSKKDLSEFQIQKKL